MPSTRKTHRGSGNGGNRSSAVKNNDVNSQRSRGPKNSEADIVEAVRTLYDDKIKPVGRILRKRLGEMEKDGSGQGLRDACENSPLLEVHEKDAGEWYTLLKNQDCDFVDHLDLQIRYDEELWASMRKFAKELEDEVYPKLSGGRYSSARDLQKLELPFLQGYTLGQLCNIVEISLQETHRIFGYLEGSVAPYQVSQSMKKNACAKAGKSLKAAEEETEASSTLAGESSCAPDNVADLEKQQRQKRKLETAKKMVRKLLKEHGLHMPVSNVKRLLKAPPYVYELSETELGYAKLTDLLKASFTDICTCELKGNRGYIVSLVPKLGAAGHDMDSSDDEASSFTDGDGAVGVGGNASCSTASTQGDASDAIDVDQTNTGNVAQLSIPAGNPDQMRTDNVAGLSIPVGDPHDQTGTFSLLMPETPMSPMYWDRQAKAPQILECWAQMQMAQTQLQIQCNADGTDADGTVAQLLAQIQSRLAEQASMQVSMQPAFNESNPAAKTHSTSVTATPETTPYHPDRQRCLQCLQQARPLVQIDDAAYVDNYIYE